MIKNKIKNYFEIMNDCILINREVIVISDIHLGQEEAETNSLNFSKIKYNEIKKKIEDIFIELKKLDVKLKQIIIKPSISFMDMIRRLMKK